MKFFVQSYSRNIPKYGALTPKKPTMPKETTTGKEYSTNRVYKFNHNTKDPIAMKNNPPVITKRGIITKHLEVTTQECTTVSTCKNLVCQQLYGSLKNAEGHTVPLCNTDTNSNSNIQNIYVYYTLHKTFSKQVEIPAGTKYVKQHKIEDILYQIENKK